MSVAFHSENIEMEETGDDVYDVCGETNDYEDPGIIPPSQEQQPDQMLKPGSALPAQLSTLESHNAVSSERKCGSMLLAAGLLGLLLLAGITVGVNLLVKVNGSDTNMEEALRAQLSTLMRLNATESQLAGVKRHNADLQTRLAARENHVQDLQTNMTTTVQDLQTNMTTTVQDLQTRLAARENHVQDLQTNMTTTVQDLQTRLAASENHVQDLQTNMTTTVQDLQTRLAASENQVKVLSLAVHSAPRCDLNPVLDCEEVYNNNVSTQSGVYSICPAAAARPVQVYCDMDTDGGKWTVIQRRVDGTVNFYRPWAQYRAGFGDASGEYWLGLENMHLLTNNRTHQLRVDMEDFEGNAAFASYSSFSVGSEADGYKLQVAGFSDGGAGDSLAIHNGMKFSTFDNDQDAYENNCARDYYGAFWYEKCHYANLNGVYLWGQTGHYATSVNWQFWKGYYYSLKAVAMKIRCVP